jgi:hypothetical protein
MRGVEADEEPGRLKAPGRETDVARAERVICEAALAVLASVPGAEL